jgi:hypothetical protein
MLPGRVNPRVINKNKPCSIDSSFVIVIKRKCLKFCAALRGWTAVIQITRLLVVRQWALPGYTRRIFLIVQLKRREVAPIVAFIYRDISGGLYCCAVPVLVRRTDRLSEIR